MPELLNISLILFGFRRRSASLHLTTAQESQNERRIFKTACLCACVLFAVEAARAQGWFQTGQDANMMLSGVDFNNSGGPLLFNHPTGIASDGTHFLLCDRFNNRVLVWNTLPSAWNAPPDLVLGQTNFVTNNPGSSKSELNWPGNVSVSSGGVVVVADTENNRVLLWRQFPNRSGQPADVSFVLSSLSSIGSNKNYNWPWGVWTDGVRLVVVSTRVSPALMFWNSLPTVDDKPPDYKIELPEFGTPRNISTDGATYFFVGDHNSGTNHDKSGTYFWNSFPTTANQPFDFYTTTEGWIKGMKLPDGRLVAGHDSSIYVWNSFPTSASMRPDLTLSNSMYNGGDGPDVLLAGGRLYVNNYNGNNVHVYDGAPSSATDQPVFALGSESVSVNTLDQINYIQNPVVATDGTRLVASSDFNRTLWIWKSIPTRSGAPPDVRISFTNMELFPWSNALYGGRLVLVGRRGVAVWDSLPLNGEYPSRVFRDHIGSATFENLYGVALDDKYFYLADHGGTLYVWNQVPMTGSEEPFRVITVPSSPLNRVRSDGTYVCVTAQLANPPSVYIYRVADIAGTGSIQPYKTVTSTPSQISLNLPGDAMTFDGALAIADSNRILLWQNLEDAGDVTKVVVLGQSSTSAILPAIGINRLFMAASLAVDGSNLWVGEFKFSSRILRFSYGAVTQNPVPALTSLSPAAASAAGADFSLTVTGSNFVQGAQVYWNGIPRATVFVSSTQLTGAIVASDLAAPGSVQVTVTNPTPGGGTSNALAFTINNPPAPTISSISPASAAAGGAAFTLTVNGTNFVSTSKVRWNGNDRTTTYVTATRLTAAIPAADIAAAGTASVTVFTPYGGGLSSPSVSFVISPAGTHLAEITSPAPGSTLATKRVTFTWTSGTGASGYWLFVGRTNGGYEIYTQDEGNGQTASVWGLPGDGSTIYVRLWSKIAGQWLYLDYTYKACDGCGPSLPGKATLISPSGTISTSTPAYTWNAVSDSTWYYLWVNDAASGPKARQWYSATQAGCASGTGTCSVTPALALASGAGQWWVQTWNDAGYGPWSDGMSFTVPGGLPGVATLLSPSGTISTHNPAYTWNAVSTASWYYLWVNDSTGTKIAAWYTAAQAGCSSGTGTCSVTPAATLASGAAQWWIQTWNSAGYGPWSAGTSFVVP